MPQQESVFKFGDVVKLQFVSFSPELSPWSIESSDDNAFTVLLALPSLQDSTKTGYWRRCLFGAGVYTRIRSSVA